MDFTVKRLKKLPPTVRGNRNQMAWFDINFVAPHFVGSVFLCPAHPHKITFLSAIQLFSPQIYQLFSVSTNRLERSNNLIIYFQLTAINKNFDKNDRIAKITTKEHSKLSDSKSGDCFIFTHMGQKYIYLMEGKFLSRRVRFLRLLANCAILPNCTIFNFIFPANYSKCALECV